MLPGQDEIYDVLLYSLISASPQMLSRKNIRQILITWFGITPDALSATKKDGSELLLNRLAFVTNSLEIAGFVHCSKATDEFEITQAGLLYTFGVDVHSRLTVAEHSPEYNCIQHHRNVQSVSRITQLELMLSQFQTANMFRLELDRREHGLSSNPKWDGRRHIAAPIKNEDQEISVSHTKLSAALNLNDVPTQPVEGYNTPRTYGVDDLLDHFLVVSMGH